ncbi:MAG: winged helix DNA-binding domain-containing protein [Anaerolineaceae bacterium]|nr:winged helix DNA-binding domain-containing protein [Anaerolineaceae bacterium]
MADRILTLREINRMTLARQMLLERSTISPTAAIEQLVGMQAQLASAPYVGLWTRLKDFQRSDLASVIENRQVIKVTMMRATLHLVSAADYVRFRTALNPVLEGAAESITKKRTPIDKDRVLKVAHDFIAEKPRTFAEISTMLSTEMPDSDVGAMRYTVRTHIPLVQVPVTTGWSYPGTPAFTLADDWLGKSISPEDHTRELVLRYLATFGPATIADVQTWSFLKLADLKVIIESLRPELIVYRDEKKKELFDVKDAPLPDANRSVPIRFLPEFDNLLLSHKVRTRVVADEHRKKVYLPALRVAATILVDGFVGAVWKVEKAKGTATISIEPLVKLTKSQREKIASEAENLVRFVEADAKSYAVKWVE